VGTDENAVTASEYRTHMTADEPTNEAEFLLRESQLAKDSLQQVRGEIFDSLSRAADVNAWTARYPWPALGTAAAAGVATGWGLGRTLWRSRKTAPATATSESTAADSFTTQPKYNAAASLVGGLGTLASALVSAVVVAATEAVTDVVKEKVHETLNPEPMPDAQDEAESESPADSNGPTM
jgi:hypothetical protein